MVRRYEGPDLTIAVDCDVKKQNKQTQTNNALLQTAFLVLYPTMVGNFAFLFNCTLVGPTSYSMMVLT